MTEQEQQEFEQEFQPWVERHPRWVLLVIAVIALAIIATFVTIDHREQHRPVPTVGTPSPQGGEPFLESWLATLRSMSAPRVGEGVGWKPFHPANACNQATDIASLLLPCDKP